MRVARALVEYFLKSNQAMEKLLRFQETCQIQKYKELKGQFMKVIQDVVTRWWSTFRMIDRLIFLREAIGGLYGAGEIDCEIPTSFQWEVLEQICITLVPIADVQRILEGENYVTGSLVPYAIYSLRETYQSVLDNDDTLGPVRGLTLVLREDLDQRYHPGSEGRVQCTSTPSIGKFIRYTTIHPALFIAAFLDPMMKGNLRMIMEEDRSV